MSSRPLPLCRPPSAFALVAPVAACLLAAITSTVAEAAEGYFQNGIGAREKALAGAGVASSTDATAVSLNPAGLTNVESQFDISVSVLRLDGGFSSSGTGGIDADGRHDSDPGLTFIPNLAATWRVNWGLVDAVALSAYGNGGVNTHYGNLANANCPPGLSGVFCGGALGVQLAQTFYSVALAKQVLPGLSVGVAPIVARQTGRLYGDSLFAGFSIDPGHFSNTGLDEFLGRRRPRRRRMEDRACRPHRRGRPCPDPHDELRQDRGLLAEQGGFDIPGTVQAGVAIDLMHNFTLMVDYKRIWFSSVASIGNPSTNFLLGNPFGADNGAGFGVRDVDVVKLGLEWHHSPRLTLRAGIPTTPRPSPRATPISTS